MDWQRLFGRQVTAGDRFEDSTPITTTAQNPAGTDVSEGDQDSNGGSGATSGSGDRNRPVITFNLDSLPEQRIINPSFDPSSAPPTIAWTTSNTSIVIEEVIWQGLESPDSDEYSSIDEVSLTGRDGQSDEQTRMDVEGNSVELSLSEFRRTNSALEDFRGNKMVIRIRWFVKNTKTSGDTVSSLFTVASEAEAEDASKLVIFKQELARDNEEYPEGSQTDYVDSGTVRGGASSSTAVPSVSTSGGAEASGLHSDLNDGGGGGGGGLSTGAIAGIAVAGAVVLLALIGGLVFWMLRRRRRGKDRGQYNNPTTSTTFMGGDKDVHQVAESPHSTYSNDQQVPLSNLAGAAATSRDMPGPSGHHHHDDDGDYVPYRDDDTGHESPDAGRRADGAGTPHGVSRSVAHLVEEGMTPDEIRRLEEEERQLDDAIQRRGQGR